MISNKYFHCNCQYNSERASSEVRAIQEVILIHAAYSRSSHARHWITLPSPQVQAPQILDFAHRRSRLFYRLKMLSNRNTNKCFDEDIRKYLDKYLSYQSEQRQHHQVSTSTNIECINKYIRQLLLYVRPSRRATPTPGGPRAAPRRRQGWGVGCGPGWREGEKAGGLEWAC